MWRGSIEPLQFNPKAAILFAAFLPQFMGLGGTSALIEFVYELFLAGSANRVAPWLDRHARMVNRAAGGLFVGIGAVFAPLNRTH